MVVDGETERARERERDMRDRTEKVRKTEEEGDERKSLKDRKNTCEKPEKGSEETSYPFSLQFSLITRCLFLRASRS
jgi:hypothetical protein